MEEHIQPLGDTHFVCSSGSGQRGGASDTCYAYVGRLDSEQKTDLSHLIDRSRYESQLFTTPSGMILFSWLTPGAIERLIVIDGADARVLTEFMSPWDHKGRLMAVDSTAENGVFFSRHEEQRWGIRSITEGLPLVHQAANILGDFRAELNAYCHGYWLTAEMRLDRHDVVAVAADSGHIETRFSLAALPAHLAAAQHAPLVACGLMGGNVDTVDVMTGAIRRFRPHIGAKQRDGVKVALASDGRYFVSWIDTGGDVMLTLLDTGQSFPLFRLDWLKPDDQLWIPDFCLQAGRLLTLRQNQVTDHGDPLMLPRGTVVISDMDQPHDIKPARYRPELTRRENLTRAGLARVTAEIEEHWITGVRFQVEPRSSLPLGASRSGGAPDVPAGFQWPNFDGVPMSFIAQFNLSELTEIEPTLRLPKSGWLLFFMALTDYGWPAAMNGDEDSTTHYIQSTSVLHVDSNDPLYPAPIPQELGAAQLLPQCVFSPRWHGAMLPGDESAAVESWSLTPAESEAYGQLIHQLST